MLLGLASSVIFCCKGNVSKASINIHLLSLINSQKYLNSSDQTVSTQLRSNHLPRSEFLSPKRNEATKKRMQYDLYKQILHMLPDRLASNELGSTIHTNHNHRERNRRHEKMEAHFDGTAVH